jgi:hypothetical protein
MPQIKVLIESLPKLKTVLWSSNFISLYQYSSISVIITAVVEISSCCHLIDNFLHYHVRADVCTGPLRCDLGEI